MQKKKQIEKGITLVALVVTIIVLLILAGITISLLLSQQGILNKTEIAKIETRGATVEEFANLWKMEVKTDTILKKSEAKSLDQILSELQDEELLTNEEVDQIKLSEKNEITIGSRTISFLIEENQIMPSEIEAKISMGFVNAVMIDKTGQLWAWGDNYFGQLGDGTTVNKLAPIKIMEGKQFKEVTTGDRSSFVIDTTRKLWGWGKNDIGQLGDGTTVNRSSPAKIMPSQKFEKIVASEWRNCFCSRY